MTSEQFLEWMMYFQVEPFGHVMQDAHFAAVESILANSNRAKSTRAYKPKEFMLVKQGVKQNAQQLWNSLKSWALMEKKNG